ncbi:MAG: carbohydrate ABC transporter permease [Eubacteriales bacterium]|nr:carbohydrate ABC transporter permease [Eubacteriales bacterium]
MKRKKKFHIAYAVPNMVLLLFSFTCVFPAIWLIYSSLKEKTEFYKSPVALPENPSIKYYLSVLSESDFLKWLLNSMRTSILSLFFILLIGFTIGYILSRYRFRGRNFVYAYFLIGMLIPVHALMVPMYIMFTRLGLNDQWFTLILPYTALSLPTAVFLVESYVKSIPMEIEEAAALDGCSRLRTIYMIVMPMCRPILITIGIIQFFYIWNEFTFSLILIDSKELMTIPVGLTLFKGQFSTDYPKMMTAMVLAILPTMIIYFIFSKQIIKGMVAGAVKG